MCDRPPGLSPARSRFAPQENKEAPERNFHLDIAARRCFIHGGNHSFDVSAQDGPLSISKSHDRDFPARQILLVPDVLVCGHQKFEARGLSRIEQSAVNKPLPTVFNRFNDHMALQGVPQRRRRAVVKEDEH